MASTVYIVERLTDYDRSDEVAAYSDEAVALAHAERENRKQYERFCDELRGHIAHWTQWLADNPPTEEQLAVYQIQEVERFAKTPGPRRAARAVLATLPTDLARAHDVRISIADLQSQLDTALASFERWATERGEHRVYSMPVLDRDPDAR